MNSEKASVSVNGRDYQWPDKPRIVVCIDGSEPAYIEQAIEAGVIANENIQDPFCISDA